MIPECAGLAADFDNRVRFEAFIADCAAWCTAVPLPADLEYRIEGALQELAFFFDADRCALLGGMSGEQLVWVTCAAFDGSIEGALGRMDFAAAFPWHLGRLAEQVEPIAVVRFDDLPPEADRDRHSAQLMGIKSMLTVPIRRQEDEARCLMIQALRHECRWPAAYVNRLPVLTRVFGDALSRQRLEETRRVEAQHSDLLESAGAILWRANARTFQTTFVSNEAEAILGYPVSSWVKVPGFWVDHIHPDDREWVVAFSSKAVQEHRRHDFEYRMIVVDGRTVWLRNIVKVIVENDQPVTLVGVTVDITERKRAEFEAAVLRHQLTHAGRVTTLGQLAATLAHELNQPLGAMVSNAEAGLVFLDRVPPLVSRLRAILEDIARDGQRAGEVVNRVRMLLQKQAFEMKPLQLSALVHSVEALVRPLALSRQVDLTINLEPALPSYGDAVQVQQVLLNLMVNAVDAVNDQPPGARRIAVRGVHRGSHVELSVSDSGHGIPAEMLPRIFDPFFTTRAGGMGMGLAICRTIVEAHGGKIEVSNNRAGGATVCFTLPAGDGGDKRAV